MNGDDHTSAELAAIEKLTDEIAGLRQDVRMERRGRRLSIALMVVALLLGGVIVNEQRRNDCESRENIISTVSVIADYADLDTRQQADVRQLVQAEIGNC